MKNLQAVFFDLDGTLLDTAEDLGGALNSVLVDQGNAPLPIEHISKYVSNGAAALIQLGFNINEQHPIYDTLRQALLDAYLKSIARYTQPYEGIMSCIEKLAQHNIKWGIVTNKPERYTLPLLEHFEFASKPCAIICPEHITHKKPAPDGLLLACKQAHCEPKNTFYIGDHIRDIECGNQANSQTIAVNYGYIPEGETTKDWNAHYIIDSATQLWPIFAKHIS